MIMCVGGTTIVSQSAISIACLTEHACAPLAWCPQETPSQMFRY